MIKKIFFCRFIGKFFWFIRKKVEMLIRLTGFPLKTYGNDKQKQPVKIVILGLDPGIQGVSNLNTKDPFFLFLFALHQPLIFFDTNTFLCRRAPLKACRLHLTRYSSPTSLAHDLYLIRPYLRNSITPETLYVFRIRCSYLSTPGTTFTQHIYILPEFKEKRRDCFSPQRRINFIPMLFNFRYNLFNSMIKYPKIFFVIFLCSSSSLAYEITLTRVFSISLWYHFAFMIISIAMLGIGASGTVL